MSKYTLYTIMAVLQMFLCTACYEDKGNYDYKYIRSLCAHR